MSNFLLSKKAKSDLIKIARYTQLNWGMTQRNNYLKILDSTFQLLADEPKLGMKCNYIRESYSKYPQASHVIYYTENVKDRILIMRILHKNMDINTAL